MLQQKIPKVLLIVLDGFGDGKDFPWNAITHSRMPFYQSLSKKFPRSQLLTSGEAVGLPPGVMGNSEVGHMNMGAGRIVYQELTRIDKAIREGEFFKNPQILSSLETVKQKKGRLHIMGLLSDAGVHSHFSHLEAILKLTYEKNVPVTVHVFTDGRDTPPTSGITYARKLRDLLQHYTHAVVGSVSGRYYAMDRDKRWDRIEKAWKVLTGQTPPYRLPDHGADPQGVKSLIKVIEESYTRNVTDEFIEPTALFPAAGAASVQNGDGIFFYNFRADRARQLTRAFTEQLFKEFQTGDRPQLATYLCLTEYDKKYGLPVAYAPQNLNQMLPDILSSQGLSQFRIAETEKYAHVTFFFNGNREDPYKGEDRLLVPSPQDVPTYDLKPEMSAPEVTRQLVTKLEKGDATFVLVNYANADMIGHTGNFEAAVKALETLDHCLQQVVSTALKSGYTILMTADHGNIEEMHEYDHPEVIHTQHTTNPVPVHLMSENFKYKLREGGVLADVAPTILAIMGIPQPMAMTGKSLLKGSRT